MLFGYFRDTWTVCLWNPNPGLQKANRTCLGEWPDLPNPSRPEAGVADGPQRGWQWHTWGFLPSRLGRIWQTQICASLQVPIFFDHSSTWLKKAGGCYETSALSSHFSKNLGIFEHLEVVLVNIQDQCFTYSHALKNWVLERPVNSIIQYLLGRPSNISN